MTIESIAKQKAKQSLSKFRISAIGLDKRGRILGSATNKPRFNRSGGGIHAEMALLKRYRKNIAIIIICRIGNAGTVLPIEPCKTCRRVLGKLGIKITTINP